MDDSFYESDAFAEVLNILLGERNKQPKETISIEDTVLRSRIESRYRRIHNNKSRKGTSYHVTQERNSNSSSYTAG